MQTLKSAKIPEDLIALNYKELYIPQSSNRSLLLGWLAFCCIKDFYCVELDNVASTNFIGLNCNLFYRRAIWCLELIHPHNQNCYSSKVSPRQFYWQSIQQEHNRFKHNTFLTDGMHQVSPLQKIIRALVFILTFLSFARSTQQCNGKGQNVSLFAITSN